MEVQKLAQKNKRGATAIRERRVIAVHTDFKKQTYCPPIVIPDIVLHKDKCKHKQTNKYCLCEIFSFFLEVTALV